MERTLPREIFLEGCKQVCSAFELNGFRFAKSGPHATRRAGDWVFQLRFQSDYLNSDDHVALMVHASVNNKALKSWDERSNWPFGAREWAAGGQLGNLKLPVDWWTWNIADPHTRQIKIADIIGKIQRIALPFFDRFNTPLRLAEELTGSEVAGFLFPQDAVRFVFWQLGAEAAERCMDFWIKRFDDLSGFRLDRDEPGLAIQSGGVTSVQDLATVARTMRIGLRA